MMEDREIRKNRKYKILTDEGFVDFEGVSKMPPKRVYNVWFKGGFYIPATIDHEIFVSDAESKPISELKIGDFALTKHGKLQIENIEFVGEESVYDILEVKNNRFYANDILVHNCRFIGKSKTLISSSTIRTLLDVTANIQYTNIVDFDVRMYKDIDRHSKYVVTLDPSMGVSGDFAAIQIFEYPSFTQAGEWMSDTVNQNDQIEKVKNICKYIYDRQIEVGAIKPEVYWTFENNTVGEGILSALREKAFTKEAGISPEKYIEYGTLINQLGNKRIGWTTLKRNKSSACAMLKDKIEHGVMKINSRMYVQQLSNYTLQEVNYAAKEGNHDDLISASLLQLMLYQQEQINLGLDAETSEEYDYNDPQQVLTEWLGDYYNNPFG